MRAEFWSTSKAKDPYLIRCRVLLLSVRTNLVVVAFGWTVAVGVITARVVAPDAASAATASCSGSEPSLAPPLNRLRGCSFSSRRRLIGLESLRRRCKDRGIAIEGRDLIEADDDDGASEFDTSVVAPLVDTNVEARTPKHLFQRRPGILWIQGLESCCKLNNVLLAQNNSQLSLRPMAS